MPRYVKRRKVRRARGGIPTATAANIGGALGGALGGFIPVPGASAVGSWLGNKAGGLLSSLWGSGDYSVKTNSLILDGKPVEGVRADSVTIRNTEYLGAVTVAAGGTFAPTGYIINPGSAATFPWLSTLARCYEEWKPNGILFRFKTTASTNSTSTNLGSIAMATEYDVYDSAPGTKVEMLQMFASTTSSVSQDLVFGVECDPRYNPRGIYFILPPDGTMQGSNRDYLLGTTYVVANEASTAGIVGELWIDYDITFSKAQAPTTNVLANDQADRWYNETAGCVSNTNNLYNSGILVHPTISLHPNSSITANRYTFDPTRVAIGEYWLVMIEWTGTAGVTWTPGFTRVDCIKAVPPWVDAEENSVWAASGGGVGSDPLQQLDGDAPVINVNTPRAFNQIWLRITGPNPYIDCSGSLASLPASSTSFRLTAMRVG